VTQFPDDFLWGAATSAFQIEGSPLADGAGPSIWYRFAHTPGRMERGETGDVACDHYRRFPEDIELMKEIGLQAYRFSVAWGRILPNGTGAVNRAGLDFYERLVDRLLEAGITPLLTLFHWDLPAALDDRGGWLNPEIADWFANYARVVAKALGDRVPMWSTACMRPAIAISSKRRSSRAICFARMRRPCAPFAPNRAPTSASS
jgi:beta-glucosidase